MKRIMVYVSDEELEQIIEIAKNYDTTPARVLSSFVADLTKSDRSGDSYKRNMAADWLFRNAYRDWGIPCPQASEQPV